MFFITRRNVNGEERDFRGPNYDSDKGRLGYESRHYEDRQDWNENRGSSEDFHGDVGSEASGKETHDRDGERPFRKEGEKNGEESGRERPESRSSKDSRNGKGSSSFASHGKDKKMDVAWADVTVDLDDYYRRDGGKEEVARAESPGGRVRDAEEDERERERETEARDMEQSRDGKGHAAPAPITRERLQASDKEKEIRRNMTTLKKNLQTEVKKVEPKEAVHPKEHKDGNAWAGRPKNAERPRPDSGGTAAARRAGSVVEGEAEGRDGGPDVTGESRAAGEPVVARTETTRPPGRASPSEVPRGDGETTDVRRGVTEGRGRPSPRGDREERTGDANPESTGVSGRGSSRTAAGGAGREADADLRDGTASGGSADRADDETSGDRGGDGNRPDRPERGAGGKASGSFGGHGGRNNRGNGRYDSRGSGSRGRMGGTFPMYRGGSRGGRGEFSRRGNRGRPPRFQNRGYGQEYDYYYEDYPRQSKDRKVSCFIYFLFSYFFKYYYVFQS